MGEGTHFHYDANNVGERATSRESPERRRQVPTARTWFLAGRRGRNARRRAQRRVSQAEREAVHDTLNRVSPTVSIAMATFQGAAFVEAQLRSCIAQTRMPDEIVVCDDGSSDDTVAICHQIGRTADVPMTVVLHERNAGVTAAFETALLRCTGDYVFLADQDDVWYSTKIAAMLEALTANPGIHLAIHDVDYCDLDLRRIGQSKIQRFSVLGIPLTEYATGMATVVSRRLLQAALPFPRLATAGHDNWLHWVARMLGVRIVVPDRLAAYRRHKTNVTATQSLNEPRVLTGREVEHSWRKAPFHRFGRLHARARAVGNASALAQAQLDWTERIRLSPEWHGQTAGPRWQSRVNSLRTQAAYLQQRSRCLEAPRLHRIKPVWSMVRGGVYASLSTAVGDIVAPSVGRARS